MANPLEIGSVSPPAPNPDGGNALQASGGGPPAGMPAKAPPPPTHEQTVAALRHFEAVKSELSILLNNPALGKSDLKKQIIDGTVKLVSERMISPADAVMQLSKVPENPIEQRKWLQGLMIQNQQAAQGILDHHRNTNLGSGDWMTESRKHNTNPDNHMHDIAALSANYGGSQ